MQEQQSDKLALKRETIIQPRPPMDTIKLVSLIVLGCVAISGMTLVAMNQAVWIQVVEQPAVDDVASDPAPVEPIATIRPMLARDLPIGTLIPRDKTLDASDGWVGVASTPGPYAALAVWSDTQLFVSRDDGRAFHQRLGGPGDIGGAVFDESATLYAVRDTHRLGVELADGRVQWRSLPFGGDTLSLAAGGGYLGWLATAHDAGDDAQLALAVSADGGVTWKTQSITGYATDAHLQIEADGTIYLVLYREDASDETMWRLRGHVDGRAMEAMPWPTGYADAWGAGHGGWAYAIASECAGEHDAICAMGPHDSLTRTDVRSDVPIAWSLQVGSNGALTLAVSGDRLLRLDARDVTVADARVPSGISELAVDGIGRSAAVIGQHLVRWSPLHGWRVLVTLDGEIRYLDR